MKDIFNEALSDDDIEEQFPKAVAIPEVVEKPDALKVVPEESEPLQEEEK